MYIKVSLWAMIHIIDIKKRFGAGLPRRGQNDLVEGANGANGVNGHHDSISINGSAENNTSLDIPKPTANGGFTHTSLSRAKISAANKGKKPWNKGKARSDEVKARIAAGVRRRNREKFLSKLAEEGITEEEYAERKKEERRKKDAERRARRTAKGGYTPTEETKKKISKILKEKYANGEVKRKPRDPSKVRRGFKHSEETKQKIRESLKRKWAEDTEYRELMTNKTVASGNVGSSVRKRISETLKKKWEDPDFRATMMEKFANRKVSSGSRHDSHRKRISDAMKKKWMDEEYRKRATEGMAKGRERNVGKVKMAKPVQPKMPRKDVGTVQSLKALSPVKAAVRAAKRSKTTATKKTKRTTRRAATNRKTTARKSSDSASSIEAVAPISQSTTVTAATKPAPEPEPEKHPDGSISRLREERRDLYDLLYGDEDGNNADGQKGQVTGEPGMLSSGMMAGVSSNTMAALLVDDDDLDGFDPYGLPDVAPNEPSPA
ncbi:hypothetical protein ACHAXT_008583 [Thalassiosira profunda]